MTLLPIVERELRLASKRSGTYWTRVWTGVLGLVLLGAAIVITQFVPRGVFGLRAVFNIVRFFGVIYCLVTGIRLTSDCISQEKRDGTLGFLFLTDMRGYDVVLGKLIAKGVLPTYTMMTIVPLVWLVSLLGGVTGGELFYTVIALGNALFFSLAVGIAVSTVFRDRRRCELIASASVFLLFFGLFPLVDHFIHGLTTTGAGSGAVGSSPVNFLTARVNAMTNPTAFGLSGGLALLISNGVVHLTSWCLIAMASWWVPRCWQERPPAGARLSFKQRWTQWCYGAPHARAVRRTAALDVNPFFWRATRNRIRPLIPWLFIALTLGIPLLVAVTVGFSLPSYLGYMYLVFIVVFWYLAPKFWIAREAVRTLSEERHDGTLEMLLSTQLSVREIVRGQWMALRTCYLIALIFPLAMTAILIILINLVPPAKWLNDLPYATPLLIAGTILFVADCITMGWVGMWCGLKMGNAQAATHATTSRVISYPMLVFAVGSFMIVVFGSSPAYPAGWPFVHIGFWLVVGLAIDLLLIRSSRSLLYGEFRHIVQNPAQAPDAWARALGRWVGGRSRRKGKT